MYSTLLTNTVKKKKKSITGYRLYPVGTRRPQDVPRTVQIRPYVPVSEGRPEDVLMGPNADVFFTGRPRDV